MRRRHGGRAVLALVVATAGAAAVATPAGAQQGEPVVEVVVSQIPNRLVLGALGSNLPPGSPVRITFSGGGGRSREFSQQVGDDTSLTWAPPRLDPCRLGASDLPGTEFTVGVEVTRPSPSAPFSLEQLITLDPDTTKPIFLAPPFRDASPKPGSQVAPGDEIGFEVIATDKTPAPSWQTGVHTLQVTGPEGEIAFEDGGRLPKPCGEKSTSLTAQGEHRVRRSDPAVIELCATAEDYVPNVNSKCAKWYKGEVWEGTFTGTGVNQGIPACPDPSSHSGNFTISVADDGTAALTGHIVNTSVCVGGFTTEADFTAEGQKTRTTFSFPPSAAFPFPVDLRIRGDRASGTSTANPGGDGIYIVTVELTAGCQSCDEG